MRVLGLITARGGSVGIPQKNIRSLGGTPLLSWTVETAKLSHLTEVILSTDSMQIQELGRSLGVSAPFLRPKELGQDSTRSIDVVLHALSAMDSQYEAVLTLQPTSPFRRIDEINAAIELLEFNPKADSVISVSRIIGKHPSKALVISHDQLQPREKIGAIGKPRQELEEVYMTTGSIYLTRVEALMAGSFYGQKALPLICEGHSTIDIDTMYDLEIAEALVANGVVERPRKSS
jgi:CMP-N,N'-diacetyllegionaminic acid synthase